ncbi:glycosyltransferase family 2 protein [Fuerstiella marisgermanici]|uniref:Putative glucosyl-3-phosphoglycerate synthase n=1 Tax=Fuerstiella marisgermanici TaxID=1891926 RepID=A0A1P8WN52_9PLAN|nr:glycosyltransferase family 2 protein [Fuerstiella marisgermanici]APZ95467.1 putative glucosyl-3-phosphoglycerate synthase [Fuerstiella marisgermanici]
MLPITVIIAAKNEESNIAKCVAALPEFERIVVLDSGSTDATASIAANYGTEVLEFDYKGGYPKKRQWALDSLDIQTPWTLLLDADEVVTESFLDELRAVTSSQRSDDGYLVTKGFHFLGKRFRFGGFSHSAVLLFRTGCARFEHLLDEDSDALDMEVHERLIVDGTVGVIKAPLIHEDFKGLEAYVARHNKYSTWEAKVRYQHLHGGDWGQSAITPKLFGNAQERRRYLKTIAVRIPFEPWLWFFYHYIARLGFLEGRPGLIASQIRASYIAQARSKLYEMRLQLAGRSHQSNSLRQPVPEPVSTAAQKAA